MPLYERAALYSIADCAVVTATRDGMNLVPYEYVVCRQGVPVSSHLSLIRLRPCALSLARHSTKHTNPSFAAYDHASSEPIARLAQEINDAEE